MPDQNATDLVMKFVLDGKPVWAECALQVDPDDKLMDDFGTNTGYDNYADFFEVSGFDFGISLKENDDNPNNPTLRQNNRPGGTNGQQGQQAKQRSMPFSSWRNAVGKEYKKIFYPLEFDDFNFERTIDAASPIFFQSCCNSKTFDSATLVKRLSVGDGGDGLTMGESLAQVGFLRIDFKEVLITSISWDDGDVVKEKVSFICKKMTIKYRQQAASGKIMDGKDEAVWPNPKNDRTLGVRTGTGG
jgi:type VI protein secretion system component Hcp